MPEQVDLPAPSGPTTTLWRIRGIDLERGIFWENGAWQLDALRSRISVTLAGENGVTKRHEWVGADADANIIALNKANLTNNSLNRRIMNKLIADGVLAGAVSGAAD